MGHSIALSGRLSFPASRAAALRSLVVDCTTYDDWPATHELFEAGASEARSVEAIIEAFQGGGLAEVEWADDSLRIAGIVGADDAAWIYGGRDLLALFRAAGSVGAAGGLGMTGWLDGGPMEVVSITTKADGSNKLSIMRASQAENAAQAIHEHVEHLAEAITKPVLPAAGPAVLPLSGPELEHHQSVVAALAKQDSQHFFELARALDTPEDTERFLLGQNPFQADPLTTRLRDADSLLSAFRQGLPRLTERDARRLAKRALELYARLDREGARALAQKAIEADLQGPVRAQAELLAVKSTDANAGLAALRRTLASNPPENTADLMDHPLIEKISKQPAARTVVLRELAALVGGRFDGSKQWKPFTTEQVHYAAALSFVLEKMLEEADDMLEPLLYLWTTHPSGELAFHDLALEHGAAARKVLSEVFGQTALDLERSVPLHVKAAEVALAHDAAAALETMQGLMRETPLHKRTEDIAQALVRVIDDGELPKGDGWRDVLLAIANAYSSQWWAKNARELASRMKGGGSVASKKPAKAPQPAAKPSVAAASPPKDAAIEKPEPTEKAEPKKTASKAKAVPEAKAAPKTKTTPKKAAPKKAAPKKAAPKKAAAPKKKAAPKKAAPKKAAPKKYGSGQSPRSGRSPRTSTERSAVKPASKPAAKKKAAQKKPAAKRRK